MHKKWLFAMYNNMPLHDLELNMKSNREDLKKLRDSQLFKDWENTSEGVKYLNKIYHT